MINRLRQRYLTLRYPYDNPIDRQRARLLLALTWAIVAALAAWVLIIFLPRFLSGNLADVRTLAAVPIVAIFEYIIYRLLQTGRLRGALWMFIAITLVVTVQQVLVRNQPGPDLTPTPIILISIPLVAAGILASRRVTILVALLIFVAVIAAGLTQNKPLTDFTFTPVQVVQVNVPDVLIALTIVLLFLLGFVGNLEQTATESIAEIQQREWITHFALELSKVDGEERILSHAVNLMSERMDYLLTRIYLMDEDGTISRSIRSGVGEQSLTEQTHIRLGDVGGISEAARTRLPVSLNKQDLAVRRNHMLASASVAVALPIASGDKLVGVLDIQSTRQNDFFGNEIAIQNLLANEIGIALYHARNIANLQRGLREQEVAVNRLQSQLQEFRLRDRQSLNEIWGQYIQGRGAGAIGFDFDAGNSLNLVAASDLPEAIYATLKNGQMHIETVGDEQVINVPIVFRNTTLGAMCFTIPKDRAAGERQLEMAQIVAERLALALENTRLFEQSQAQAVRERKASEVGSLLIGATDVRTLLNLAAEQFNEALGAVHTQIFIQPDILAEPLAQTDTEKEEAR